MNSAYYLFLNNLNEEETQVVKNIISHTEKNGKVGIRQIANENFVSTAYIVRLCQKLGFKGYSELLFYLTKTNQEIKDDNIDILKSLISNFSQNNIDKLKSYLDRFRTTHIFVVGNGFADTVTEYIVQRLALCGFMVFNKMHLYDFMVFRDSRKKTFVSNVKPSLLIVVSQSGETQSIIDNATRAKEQNFNIVSFTRVADSTLARMSDVVFEIEPSHQNLIGETPNLFFGKVILAFELIMSEYLRTS